MITGAAAIMAAVFVSFATAPIATVSQMGVGLTVAILLDATVVRIVLLPALMLLLGDRVWRVPRLLDRILPRRNVLQSKGGRNRGVSGNSRRGPTRMHKPREAAAGSSTSLSPPRCSQRRGRRGGGSADPRRNTSTRLERICKPDARATQRAMKGARGDVRAERLAPAAPEVRQGDLDLRLAR